MTSDPHPSRTLPAFNDAEFTSVKQLLAARVSTMMGRKMEEADWADVYCEAKGIPKQTWSNLGIDIVHNGLGVEHKMLRHSAKEPIQSICGSTLMHPSATRSIRVPTTKSASDAMEEVLEQYRKLIEQRSAQVRKTNPTCEPDMRLGWLLWQESLVEFLYFEERMLAPDPKQFNARWVDRGTPSGLRKSSRSLWIYSNESGRKRFSVTTEAGAKIQPYFDVPPANDPNLYILRAQGIPLEGGRVQVWVTPATAREIERLVGPLVGDGFSAAILRAAGAMPTVPGVVDDQSGGRAVAVEISGSAYEALNRSFAGVSDEDRIRTVASALQKIGQ